MAQDAHTTPRTIIVPLDGSETSEQALPYARVLAARNGAGILLVSIVDIPAEFNAWAVTTVAGQQLDAWIGHRQQYLDRLARTFEGVEARTSVELGGASPGILDIVRATPNPVVAMASHGRSGVRRLVLGSVAARVLGEADCPVLVVRATGDAAAATAPDFGRALVPLDGSAFGEAALARGLSVLGNELDVHLLRVVDTPGLDVIGSDEPELSLNYGLIAEYMDAVRQEATEYLARVSAEVGAQGHRVTSAVQDGAVATAINRAAEVFAAGVIVMATHGRGGLSRLVMGSVAERVLQGATRPLLLVRPQ